jgi:hypothetical protein
MGFWWVMSLTQRLMSGILAVVYVQDIYLVVVRGDCLVWLSGVRLVATMRDGEVGGRVWLRRESCRGGGGWSRTLIRRAGETQRGGQLATACLGKPQTTG